MLQLINAISKFVDVLEVWRNADAVCFDVDSTVCLDEGIDELAEFCGAGKAVAEWTARYGVLAVQELIVNFSKGLMTFKSVILAGQWVVLFLLRRHWLLDSLYLILPSPRFRNSLRSSPQGMRALLILNFYCFDRSVHLFQEAYRP